MKKGETNRSTKKRMFHQKQQVKNENREKRTVTKNPERNGKEKGKNCKKKERKRGIRNVIK